MDFMSIEVAAQEFLFSPSRTVGNIAEFNKKVSAIRVRRGVGKALSKVPFSHNHLHDLESLWWVAAWVAFYNDFFATETLSPLTLEDAKKWLDLARNLFPPVPGMSTRLNGFQNAGSFEAKCQQLGPEKELIALGLDVIREHLIEQYKDIEARLPESVNPEESGDDIYDIFANVFSSLADDSKGLELKPIAVIHNQLLKEEMKNQRSGSINDAGSSKVPRK